MSHVPYPMGRSAFEPTNKTDRKSRHLAKCTPRLGLWTYANGANSRRERDCDIVVSFPREAEWQVHEMMPLCISMSFSSLASHACAAFVMASDTQDTREEVNKETQLCLLAELNRRNCRFAAGDNQPKQVTFAKEHHPGDTELGCG
ncbi:hypothetical protein J3459_008458 [Metarhizium acridum]|uniref:uncharacterized protein n=1 Tax=Metarhizium acridum TaxID=92637 RepID=UPI001C6D1991|nr:hypothetical protein J3458_000271 [Metarhizium acridum]KAG8426056.1 hypothetical protein J3459_008458 [Metarhizium acridum]